MNLLELIAKAADVSDALRSATLNELLVKARVEAIRMAEENLKLREELLDLRAAAHNRETLAYEQRVYWRKAEGAEREGPFCPRCFDGDQKVVRLDDSGRDYWSCRVCSRSWDKPGRARGRSGGGDGGWGPQESI